MEDREVCPRCHKLMVFADHANGKWCICCAWCGFLTGWYGSYREARANWEKLKREYKEDPEKEGDMDLSEVEDGKCEQ